MGTRHVTIVKLDKKVMVAQYGQWDGYLGGQGYTIADFLQKKFNVSKFKKALRACRFNIGTAKLTTQKINRCNSYVQKVQRYQFKTLIAKEF